MDMKRGFSLHWKERKKNPTIFRHVFEKRWGQTNYQVYRKETHTQRYINWRSNHPKNCLLGVLKGLIHRAHTLCDMKEDLIDELGLLHDVFIANGYPEHLVRRTIKESWSKEFMKSIKLTL